jgi:hypothetical protein
MTSSGTGIGCVRYAGEGRVVVTLGYFQEL